MKKLLLSAVGMLFAFGTFAQSSGLGFGVKAGVNFPSYNFSGSNSSYETNSATNFHLTAFLDAPLVGRFLSVQPGLSLQGKGAELLATNSSKLTQNTMWLEIPVNLVAKVPVGSGNVFVGAGPYAAFGLSGKNKFDSKWGGTESDFDFGKNGTLKSSDFGLNVIAGFQMGGGLMVHGGYGMGLSDIRGSNNEYFTKDKLTNRVWTIGLGFAL